MKMSNYWDKRQKQWIDNQDKADEQLTKKLEKEYRKTASELEKEIARYFQMYGEDGVIEFRTLMKELPASDKKLLFEDFEAFAEEHPEYEHLLPVRESIYKLNRLEGLHYSTQLELLELGAIEQKEIDNHLRKTYGKHFEYVAKELGLGNQFLALDSKVITDTIYKKWVDDGNFSTRIWGNKEKLLNHITTVYRDGLVRGDDYKQMSVLLSKRLGVALNDAKRLVWTESSFVLNQAHAQPYVEAGVTEYRINAIIDSRTSDICRELHKQAEKGETFRFDEMMVGINYPPFHSWCRSVVTGVGLDKLLD